MTTQIDENDRQILDLLRDNGRLTNGELAERIGLSASQCSRRRIALEQAGLILGYHAHLSPQAEGTPIMGMIEVRMISHTAEAAQAFRNFIQQESAIRDVFKLTGDYDYLLKITVADLAEMNHLINALSVHACVSNLRTAVVLERLKENCIMFADQQPAS